MLRFSLPTSLLAIAALFSTTLAFGQAPATSAGSTPPPAAPAASTPAPTSAPASTPGGAGPTSRPTGAAIDRGSLLEPAPSPRSGAAAQPAATAGEGRENERRTDSAIGANPKEVYADDWWVRSRPILELHGYLRVRAELFHGFALGRLDAESVALWPLPPDNDYTNLTNGQRHQVILCGDSGRDPCTDKSQAGANMRFRVNPELHVSDNVRILSQIDMLDNLVLGSTPGGYASQPNRVASNDQNPAAANTVPPYQSVTASPYAPIGAFASTQAPPTAGINSFQNSVAVKRAWGEYATPVGQLRFGRMPSHWGLGILENSGDTFDSDWQSTVDRVVFTTGIKPLDLYFSGAWDFPNEGATSATLESTLGGQPYDLAQLDDVNQYVGMIARRRDPELAKLDLARGNVVVNGGAYFAYRDQYLAPFGTLDAEAPPLGTSPGTAGGQIYSKRNLKEYVPDLWFQLLYRKFRFEVEGVMIAGSLQSAQRTGGGTSYTLRQFGLASQTEFRAVEDRLRLQFGFGWASGDKGLLPDDPNRTSSLSPSRSGTTLSSRVAGDTTYSEFRFHPDYRVDLILHRNILSRVQGEYYFRPSVDYDFSRSAEGQKFGGGAAIIWSRASEFIQSPGHKRDLGLEIDLSLYYQSKDGSLNDNPDKMGGFFTMLQYGVLFPFGGLSHLPTEAAGSPPDTSTAHMLRWFIGILY